MHSENLEKNYIPSQFHGPQGPFPLKYQRKHDFFPLVKFETTSRYNMNQGIRKRKNIRV